MMGLHHFHGAWHVLNFEGCISWQGGLKRDCLARFMTLFLLFLTDIQDSQFSPCFPLLMYPTQGPRFSDETLLQRSEMDFVPLR